MWDQVKQALMQSTTRFLTRFASLLPGMVALILALLVSIVLAFILAYVIRQMLTRLRFAERLVQWGFSSPAETTRLFESGTLKPAANFGAFAGTRD